MKPGTYRAVVTLDVFKKAAVDQVKLDVQGIREIEVTVEIGGAAETVTATRRRRGGRDHSIDCSA